VPRPATSDDLAFFSTSILRFAIFRAFATGLRTLAMFDAATPSRSAPISTIFSRNISLSAAVIGSDVCYFQVFDFHSNFPWFS